MENKVRLWFRAVLDFVIMDLLQFLRSPAGLITTLLTPITMIASFGLGTSVPASSSISPVTSGSYFQFVAPGIMFVGIMFSSTFTMGYGILVDKRKRIAEDVITSSIPYSAFVSGRFFSMLIKSILQMLIIVITAILFFDLNVKYPGMLLLAITCTTFFFAGFGVLLAAGTDEIAFSGLSNMLLVPLFYFSGVFFPIENFGGLGKVLQFLPSSIQVKLFRYSILGDLPNNILLPIILALVFTLIMVILPSLVFKSAIKK
ncbi:ABC transporter permease [Ruminiclostridium cellulolyticum]|uniref:Transport permease protein n=1 Tax=Ruminiclostridium cellulolyticum (strain ATCC 35319 / DSM 5812 / JCM 6584 / H10) TaxID=394503 RepID=B8I969_RUMCH|nr:ABC transporter permease [Ruminiclostridium cellulolyticum]ACL75329.1 ABC-2 type transporter [Ruminiclostridium cellulolyticum H10]